MTAVVHRVVGPPGCGKTTWLSRQCLRAAEKYGPDAALVVSLTRAAAREAGGRETGLSPEMVGTLHSHAYRSIGRPPLAEKPSVMREFSEKNPAVALTTSEPEWGDGRPGATDGDRLLSELNLLRHRMVPRERWGREVLRFEERWSEHKAASGAVDFCDMIDEARERAPMAPGRPPVIFADEAQDLSALELDLLYRWGRHAEHVTLVYDPAQALYGWRGSDPSLAAAEPTVPPLRQSQRVPKAVQEYALSVIRRSSTYREAAYDPRPGDPGRVAAAGWRLRDPEVWVDGVDDPFLGPTMVLASCSYMLEKAVAEMRRLGVAYHNPFSPNRWNPLKSGTSERRTAVDRLLAFLSLGGGDRGDVPARAALELVHSSVKKGSAARGAEAALASAPARMDGGSYLRLLRAVLGEEGAGAALAGDVGWYASALTSANARSAEYPMRVLARSGERLLREVASSDRPVPGAVVVGTVHSVKGGEAERVVLFPDLSARGFRGMREGPGWLKADATWRMMYVGCTRARRELVVCAPSWPRTACPMPRPPR